MIESVWHEQFTRSLAWPQSLGREEERSHSFRQCTSDLAARLLALLASPHRAGIKRHLFSFAHRSGKLARNELAAKPMLISLACACGQSHGNSKSPAA
jgi:hypothetical protein